MLFSRLLLRVLIVCLIFALATRADIASPKSEQRNKAGEQVDRHGDPLPAGALARLGTARLRHSGEVHLLAFAADGKTIISCGKDGWAHRWEVTTGKRLGSIRCPEGHSFLCLSGDGRVLATVGEAADKSDKVILWQTATGKPGPEIYVKGLLDERGALSTDGNILATGSYHGTLRLWDTATGRLLRRMKWEKREIKGEIEGLVFSPDSRTLASRGLEVALWDPASGANIQTLSAAGSVDALAFAPDGKTVLTGSFLLNSKSGVDWNFQVWDLGSGKEVRSFKDPQAKKEPSLIQVLVSSPDGRFVALSDYSTREFLLLDAATGKVVRRFGERLGASCAAFSPDSKTLATGDLFHRVRLWEVDTGREKLLFDEHTSALNSVALSADAKTVATTSYDGAVRLWAFPSGKHIRSLRGHDGAVLSAAFSPLGGLLATAGADGTVRLWDPETGRQVRKINSAHEDTQGKKGEAAMVRSLAFSPDGKSLATGGADQVRLWETDTGKLLRTVRRKGTVSTVFFTPDGKKVGCGGLLDGIYLWEAATGDLIKEWPVASPVIALSPDGRILVATSALFGVWEMVFLDLRADKVLAQLNNAKTNTPEAFLAAAFSPDSRTLALGSRRGIFLRDAATSRQIRHLQGDWGRCTSVAFIPDGRTLIAGNGDGTVLFWDLTGLPGAR
jgi:WD40 repeat protein